MPLDAVALMRFCIMIHFCISATVNGASTVEALPLEAIGTVRWWPEERREITLQRVVGTC